MMIGIWYQIDEIVHPQLKRPRSYTVVRCVDVRTAATGSQNSPHDCERCSHRNELRSTILTKYYPSFLVYGGRISTVASIGNSHTVSSCDHFPLQAGPGWVHRSEGLGKHP